MSNDFGQQVRERRAELRLTLREFSARAGMDPGNVSRLERGRLPAPQDAEVLSRIVEALELTGTPRGQTLVDVAATSAGRIPRDMLENDALMATLPILLRTVNNKRLNASRIEKLVELIRKS